MRHLTYLALLGACVIATLPLELFLHVRVYARLGRLMSSLLPVLIVFGAWDLWASASHTWRYDARYVLGAYLPGRLPVEELVFFLVVPTCAILTLEAVRTRRPTWRIGDESVGRR